MHYAVCRAAGWPVCGPPPQDLIGAVPRRAIPGYLAGELGWGIGHAPEAYAGLNACRALVYLADHTIVSKIAGGHAVLSRGAGPAKVIERALAQQRGSGPGSRRVVMRSPSCWPLPRCCAPLLLMSLLAGRGEMLPGWTRGLGRTGCMRP